MEVQCVYCGKKINREEIEEFVGQNHNPCCSSICAVFYKLAISDMEAEALEDLLLP